MTEIKLYTKPNCPQCRATKMYLNNLNIPYQEIKGLEHIPELKARGFKQFPVIMTESDSWAGFQPSKIQKLA